MHELHDGSPETQRWLQLRRSTEDILMNAAKVLLEHSGNANSILLEDKEGKFRITVEIRKVGGRPDASSEG